MRSKQDLGRKVSAKSAKTWRVIFTVGNAEVLKSRQQPIWTAHYAHKLLHSTCNRQWDSAKLWQQKGEKGDMAMDCCCIWKQCSSLKIIRRDQRQSLFSIYTVICWSLWWRIHFHRHRHKSPCLSEGKQALHLRGGLATKMLKEAIRMPPLRGTANVRMTTPVVPWPEKMRASSWVAYEDWRTSRAKSSRNSNWKLNIAVDTGRVQVVFACLRPRKSVDIAECGQVALR